MTKTKPNAIKKQEILAYLKDIKPYLRTKGIAKIALFGSFAQDRADIYSDIDLAFKLEKDYLTSHTSWDYFNLLDEVKSMLSKRFYLKCDLLDLDSESSVKEYVLKELIYV